MSASATLTPAQLAPMIRAAMKDQSYRSTPVGTMVGRYIRWLRMPDPAFPPNRPSESALQSRVMETVGIEPTQGSRRGSPDA